MSNLQRFVGLKQIRRQAKSDTAVFAIIESDLQYLDEEVDLSTSFHLIENDLVLENLNNDKDNQLNNLNIFNQHNNNSNNCEALFVK